MINAKKYFIAGIAFFAFGCSLVKESNLVETTHSSKKVVVLAIDGGGIKGIIPAIFLQSIEASLGKPSYQLFDVIGGTSTGGIISSALTSLKPKKPTPYSANDIVNVYKNQGDNIFVAQNCKIEFCAIYYADNKKGGGVEPYLQKMLGISTSLSDSYQSIRRLPNARVSQMFTTSYIVNSHGKVVNSPILGKDYGPYLFNWQDAIKTPNTHNYYIWEAARATSAAPTYFPIAHAGGGAGSRSLMPEKWVIDGGTMSNDPAVWGVTEALRTGIATKLEDIVVISLGTGVYPGAAGVGVHNNAVGNNPYDGNWSTTPWMVEKLYDLEGAAHSRGVLMSIVLDAVQLVSNSQLVAMQSAGLQYYRLEPALTLAQSQMDNISNANIQSLMSTAENYLQSKQGAEILKNIISELKKQ
ncbi:MAG: patatin-like phospholipase family protein [Cellvibrionaceae bacterium]